MARRKVTRAVVPPPDDIEPEEIEGYEYPPDEPMADNALEVPMFADIDGRTTRSITQLRLLKLEPGGPPAYKGTIPLNSTLETIGNVYGDGIYTIEGLNHRHTVLASKDNIRISLATVKPDAAPAIQAPSVDADRIERLARASAIESQENNKSFTQLVLEITRSAAEREAAAHTREREQMTQFFASMMTMAQQGFERSMAMVTAGNNTMIASLQAVNQEKKGRADDSTKLVDMLLKGMRLGRDIGDGNDKNVDPPYLNILKDGFKVLANTQQGAGSTQLQAPAAPITSRPPPPVRTLSAAQRRMIRDALTLYKGVRARGIDPDELLERLSEVEHPAPPPEPEHVPDSDDDEEDEEAEHVPDLDDDEEDDDDLDGDESEDEDESESESAHENAQHAGDDA